MELRDLRYFCLTAELEHVSRAAEKLGVSQPFLTKVISQLETEIGTQLFNNVGRHVRLNEYGKVFYERAKKLLTDVEHMLEEMDTLLEHREKSVSMVSDSGGYTSALMIAYKTAYPNNLLSITYGMRTEIVEALKAGTVDFALCTPPMTDEVKNLETEIVFREFGCIVLPPGHPYIGRETISLRDLEDEPLVTSPKGAGVRNNIENFFGREGITPKIVCESNDMDLLLRAVKSGLGYAVMPRRLMYEPEWKPYSAKLDFGGAAVEIGISYNKNIIPKSIKDEFLKFVREYFLTVAQ